jgi:hypothetical protein
MLVETMFGGRGRHADGEHGAATDGRHRERRRDDPPETHVTSVPHVTGVKEVARRP